MCWSFGVVGLEWYPCCRLNTDTTPTQPYRNSNTHRTKNNMTSVVIQQNSRKLLMMDILMSETCWAHKKWNKIASDIKLVFYSSTNTMMRGPINIRWKFYNTYVLSYRTIQIKRKLCFRKHKKGYPWSLNVLRSVCPVTATEQRQLLSFTVLMCNIKSTCVSDNTTKEWHQFFCC